jgi:cyanate permease
MGWILSAFVLGYTLFQVPGGWLSPTVTAYIATHLGWTQALDFAAVVGLTAPLWWLWANGATEIDRAPAT